MRKELVLAVTVAGMLVGAPPAAAEPAVTCGGTYSTDITLTADMSCDRIWVPAITLLDGADLDLGGHVLTVTSGTAVTSSSGSSLISHGTIRGNRRNGTTAVFAGAGDGTVTVRDVTLVQHGTALVGREGRHLVLDGVTVRDTNNGLDCDGPCVVRRSTFVDNDYAVNHTYGLGITISDSTICGSRTGFSAFSPEGPARIERTTFYDNDTAVLLWWWWGDGRADLVANVFRHNGIGYHSEDDWDWVRSTSNHQRLTGNLFVENGDGVQSTSRRLTMHGNVAVNNRACGFQVAPNVDLTGNLARGNGSDGLPYWACTTPIYHLG